MEKRWFKWTVEFQVERALVEDGFDLDNERAYDMLANDLRYANNTEIRAKVKSKPKVAEIRKAQGYAG